MKKYEIVDKVLENGVIAIIRRVDPNMVEPLIDNLVSAGVSAVEITVDSLNSFELIETISKKFKGKAIVGAGTVLDEQSAYRAIRSGANFIISPTVNEDVIRLTSRYGKVSIPGVYTPTEMIKAVEAGGDLLKIFPARHLGPNYLKDIRGPLPHIPLIPTGGVNLSNIGEFIQAGASAVGIGSNLVDNNLISDNKFDKIKLNAERYVNAVKKARNV